jgi:hypothetical protein
MRSGATSVCHLRHTWSCGVCRYACKRGRASGDDSGSVIPRAHANYPENDIYLSLGGLYNSTYLAAPDESLADSICVLRHRRETVRQNAGETMSRELLLKGGLVVTVDDALGDVPDGDVLTRDNEVISKRVARQAQLVHHGRAGLHAHDQPRAGYGEADRSDKRGCRLHRDARKRASVAH